MVIGATTIGRELRDKQIGRWYDFIESGHLDLTNIEANIENDKIIAASTSAEDNNTSVIDSKPRKASVLILLFGLLGKYFWPMLAYSLWSVLALWLANPQQALAISSIIATYIGLVLLMMLSFWLGAIFTLTSFSLRMGLSSTGFISAPSYAFAGVTFPYIAISDSAQHWSNVLPLTHYLKLHIAQLQMQAPVAISLPIVYGLTLATLITMFLTTLLSKRALAHPERWGAR